MVVKPEEKEAFRPRSTPLIVVGQVMPYMVMPYIVVACIVMAYTADRRRPGQRPRSVRRDRGGADSPANHG